MLILLYLTIISIHVSQNAFISVFSDFPGVRLGKEPFTIKFSTLIWNTAPVFADPFLVQSWMIREQKWPAPKADCIAGMIVIFRFGWKEKNLQVRLKTSLHRTRSWNSTFHFQSVNWRTLTALRCFVCLRWPANLHHLHIRRILPTRKSNPTFRPTRTLQDTIGSDQHSDWQHEIVLFFHYRLSLDAYILQGCNCQPRANRLSRATFKPLSRP